MKYLMASEGTLTYNVEFERDCVRCTVYDKLSSYTGTRFLEAETRLDNLRNYPVRGTLKLYVNRQVPNPNFVDSSPSYTRTNIERCLVAEAPDTELPLDIALLMKFEHELREGRGAKLDSSYLEIFGLKS